MNVYCGTHETPPVFSRPCACRAAECRPNQRNCLRCHALANQVYRLRVKHSAEKADSAFFKAMQRHFSNDNPCDPPEVMRISRQGE